MSIERDKDGQHRRTGAQVYSHTTGRAGAGRGIPLAGYPHTVPISISIPISPDFTGWRAKHNTLENTGIRAGSIIAHRAWLSDPAAAVPVLRSLAVVMDWPATGIMTGDVAQYGVFSFKDKALLLAEYGQLTWPWGLTTVFGTVALWGQIVEHDHGYRSEFAKIKTVDTIDGRPGLYLSSVRDYYGLGK